MDKKRHFDSLSSQARVWVYPVDTLLSSEQVQLIESSLDEFIKNWNSHGRKVNAEAAILHNRFIVIAAEIPEAEISGCGIDASVHALELIGKETGFSVLSGLNVFYKDSLGSIHALNRSAFRQLVRSSQIDGSTIVFDPSITTLEQFNTGAFELPARSSWHAMVFKIPVETT